MTDTTDKPDERPQYSMVIEFDPREGGYYVVSFPEWEAMHYRSNEFGTTYEEAAAKGRNLLEFLIQSAKDEGEPLPPARIFTDDEASASTPA